MEHVNAETNIQTLFSQDSIAHAHCTHVGCLFMAISVMEGTGNGLQGPRGYSEGAICYHPAFSLAQASLEGSTVPYNPSSVKSQSISQIILFPHNMLLKKWPIAMRTWALFLLFTGKTSRCSYRVNILHFKNVLKHHCSYNSCEVKTALQLQQSWGVTL